MHVTFATQDFLDRVILAEKNCHFCAAGVVVVVVVPHFMEESPK